MESRTDQLRNLAKVMHDIRPDWHTNGILRVLEQDSRPIEVLRRLGMAAASDATARGPGVIATRNEAPVSDPPAPPSIRDVLGAPTQPESVAIAGAKAVREAVAAADLECLENRAAVLAYPDLAEMLTKPPMGYARPEQWNGYVPPRTDPDGALNTSQARVHLLALVTVARQRKAKDRW